MEVPGRSRKRYPVFEPTITSNTSSLPSYTKCQTHKIGISLFKQRLIMKTSFCCICRSSVKTLGSRTLLLEEKSLPQQDKPIYNALLDVMHDSPLPVCKALLPPCHLERARGSAEQGVRYCRKDGDYVEFGDVPNCDQRGRRTDWERFCDWARHLDAQPTDREIIEQFPSLFGRYAVSCRRIASELCQSTPLRQGELRPWQAALYARLQEDADDRTVEFFVDRDGGIRKVLVLRIPGRTNRWSPSPRTRKARRPRTTASK